MARIKTVREWLDGKEIAFDLCYSVAKPARGYSFSEGSAGFFYINLPKYIDDVLYTSNRISGRVTGETELECAKELKEVLKLYSELKTTEKKVIFYEYKSRVQPLDFNSDSISSGANEMCSKGVAMDLWFAVGYVINSPKTCTPSTNNELYLDADHKEACWRRNKTCYMPYTPEREMFFLMFRDYLISGIEKMKAFFANSELAMPLMIDNAIKSKALPFRESPTEKQ
jgi:hypothetical protein